MATTTVFTNACVHTMVPGNAPEEALAFTDGAILAVGDAAAVRAAAGPDARHEDLGGRAVTPGFIDAHHHFLSVPIEGAGVDCSPGVAPSIEALQRRLRERHRALPEGAWLVGLGYDEHALAERRHPRRAELDDACPGRAVLLCHYSEHEAVASSRALELAGIDRHTPDPPAGLIDRGRGGVPTGRLIETAFSRVYRLAEDDLIARDADATFDRIAAYERRLFEVGLTRVVDPTVSPDREALYRRAVERGALRMPMILMPASSEGLLCTPRDRLAGAPTGDGSEQLRVGPLKLFFDGATRCAMRLSLGQVAGMSARMLVKALRARSLAAVRSTGDVGLWLGRDLAVRSGVRFLTLDESKRLAEQACERGFAIAIHAIGNDAVEQAIETLAQVRHRHPAVAPPRIEHASILTAELARRAGDAGIAVAAQPYFIELPVFHEMPLPPGFRLLAHRTLLDAGVRVAGSSDAPVTGFDPIAAMRAAVTRRTRAGKLLQAEEAVAPGEALAMYTREAAFVCGCGERTGTLEPGKRADLVVLSDDPLTALDRAAVTRTILAGETVYAAG